MLQAGWREDELTNALSAYADIAFPVPVPRPKPYLQAREAFLYLVSLSERVWEHSAGRVCFGLEAEVINEYKRGVPPAPVRP